MRKRHFFIDLIEILTFYIVLRSLVTLLEQPNPDDPLMTEIAELYTTNHAKFVKTAKEHTKKVRERRGTKYLLWFVSLCNTYSNQLAIFSLPLPHSTLLKKLPFGEHKGK